MKKSKKRLKKRQKAYVNKITQLRNKINIISPYLNNPTDEFDSQKMDSERFGIIFTKQNELFNNDIPIKYDKYEHDGYFTKRVKLYPTPLQKQVLLKWMDCYILMYNSVIRYIKQSCFHGKKIEFSNTKLKNKFHKTKEDIVEYSHINHENGKKVISINKHILDYAINDAIVMYKSCLTNLKMKHIKHFRLRYLKRDKPNRILKLEKEAFTEDGFCTNALGKHTRCEIEDYDYTKKLVTMSTIFYSKNEFYLLKKYKVTDMTETPKYINKEDTIAIDLGVYPLGTGYSNDHILEIGTDIGQIIERKLIMIDKVSANEYLTLGEKNRIINKKFDQIKNLVNDMQWKIIDYLTRSYKNIIVGNFSTKRMGETDSVTKMTKRVGNLLSIYKFKERLQYKCKYTNTNYKEIDEWGSSKSCSVCGYWKKDLGKSKVYHCDQCGTIMNRDVNGSKIHLVIAYEI